MTTAGPPALYTTTIDADKTISEITSILARHGARGVVQRYDAAGRPTALGFQMPTLAGLRWFYLPANTDRMLARLERLSAESPGRLSRRYATPEHAARVAWRIVRQWIVAQLEIIASEQITLEQAMLAWTEVGEPGSGRLLYDEMVARGFVLPPTLGRASVALPEGDGA